MLKQNKREGLTKITSVSVSNEFVEIVDRYNLSPTEVFRKGVAVNLCDMGIEQYNTPLNIERLKYVNDFLNKIKKEEELRKEYEKIEEFKEIKKLLKQIKTLVNKI